MFKTKILGSKNTKLALSVFPHAIPRIDAFQLKRNTDPANRIYECNETTNTAYALVTVSP